MNYTCFIVKIVNQPIFSRFDGDISLVELTVKFSSIRKTKMVDTFRILVWGTLAEETMKYYHKNDYIIVEGYIRNFSEPGEMEQVEISARKIYPFLLKTKPNLLI